MTYSTVLFDLDSTLYPASSGVPLQFEQRMAAYVQQLLGVDADEAAQIRKRYSTELGTTLRGLQTYHEVDIEDYLRYVHDIDLATFLAVDAELDRLLGEVRYGKAIFTNAPREHAERVLQTLNIAQHFSHIFDIRFAGFVPKPNRAVYDMVLDMLQVAPSEVIFIEDTPGNLAPARALGMTTILIDDQADAASMQVDHVVPNVLEALRVVLAYQREQSQTM
jgi:putative hydrolase of the HAD superfamily